jgi:hypothetical protein
MRFARYGLTFIFAVAPVAVSGQSLRAQNANSNSAYSRTHDDEHSRLERAHQQWHFEHDRGQRDGTYQREHEVLHQRLTQAHNQWHAQYDPRGAYGNATYNSRDYGSDVRERRVRDAERKDDSQDQRQERHQNEDHR